MKDPRIIEILTEAHERLESAEALHKIHNYRDSISRSYYAVFDATRAALLTEKIEPKSHAGAIAKFHLAFLKSNRLPRDLGRILNLTQKARTEADYSFESKVTKEDSETTLENARKFVDVVEKFLKEL